MSDKLNKDFWDMLDSLQLSLRKAGGLPFDRKRLEKLSAVDLLAGLAPNHIRFTYVKEKDGEQ